MLFFGFFFQCFTLQLSDFNEKQSQKLPILSYANKIDYIQEFEINKAGILKFYEGAIQLHSIKDIFYSDLIKLYTCYSYYVEQVEANNKRMEELIKTRQNGR